MKLIGETTKRKRPVKWNQQEMFPEHFHENYKVVSHIYHIGEDGKSVWTSTQITWRTQ